MTTLGKRYEMEEKLVMILLQSQKEMKEGRKEGRKTKGRKEGKVRERE